MHNESTSLCGYKVEILRDNGRTISLALVFCRFNSGEEQIPEARRLLLLYNQNTNDDLWMDCFARAQQKMLQ